MRIISKNLVYYQSLWGKGPFIRFILDLGDRRDIQNTKIDYLLKKYNNGTNCGDQDMFHLLSHLIIGITKSFATSYDPECIQKGSLEKNELRIPLLYRYTSITIVEELLDWLSNKEDVNYNNWENSIKIIKNEYEKDRESDLVYNFRMWLVDNNIPVYEYEHSRSCWIIGEGKNKFFLYREFNSKEQLCWSLRFSNNQSEWNKINYSLTSKEPLEFQNILGIIMEKKKSLDLRIPIFLVTGTNGKTTTARIIAKILKESNEKVGLTTSSGLTINNKFIEKGDLTGPWSARNVVSLDDISYAVIETARGGILKEGIAIKGGFEGASIITNISKDHLGMKGIESLNEMTEVKFQVVDAILNGELPKGRAIVNADDEFIMNKVKEYDLKEFWGFSLDKSRLEGFPAGIYLKDKHLYFFNRKIGLEEKIISILEIPASFNGKATFNVVNSMAAAASCLSFGVPINYIETGLKTFKPDHENSLGRNNLIDFKNFRIFLDYAHNPAGLDALRPLISSIKADKKILITMTPGDRDDDFISEMASKYILLNPDLIIVKELQKTRGREKGEVANLMKNYLITKNYPEDKIFIELDEQNAVELGLSLCHKNDLLIAFIEDIEQIYDFIQSKL